MRGIAIGGHDLAIDEAIEWTNELVAAIDNG